MAKKKKKRAQKPEKFDGLNPADIKRLITAIRKVWSWSYSRQLVITRCLIDGGFSRCEKCRQIVPKVYVDHKKAIGTFGPGYIERTFLKSTEMQGLCKKCHGEKTKADNAINAVSKRDAKKEVDF